MNTCIQLLILCLVTLTNSENLTDISTETTIENEKEDVTETELLETIENETETVTETELPETIGTEIPAEALNLPQSPKQKYCKSEGQYCSRTIFHRCCGNLVCQLHGFFNGTCVQCLAERKFCIWSSECCSKRCRLFRCRKNPYVQVIPY
ncbi:UPF0506 protein [Schistosoma japonicum]|uniref:UPF0506 protein SJCHGC03047 n=2 Tax=Schistosoma japonicum TaxID=6182 RepID=SJ047_SCHJA|nr:RecName: Full=UPF0506 protein SJCHGC03047; Flags: Precursor [Schistosoma japonicum]AAW26582.1 SJCHGC03047 protein [Schistosoma japonicum]TNN14788.1 UPF0506 protein [Schistosoma japonicum]